MSAIDWNITACFRGSAPAVYIRMSHRIPHLGQRPPAQTELTALPSDDRNDVLFFRTRERERTRLREILAAAPPQHRLRRDGTARM